LLKHPAVALAAAVGQPDSYSGELPVAYVVLKAGSAIEGDALVDFVAPLVGDPAARPKHVAIISEMPLTPVGKIYKPALRVLAVTDGFEQALAHAGLSTSDYKLSVSESSACVEVFDPTLREEAQKALLGMPVKYSFVEASSS
jgi:fatty-acyl-CoA synthase